MGYATRRHSIRRRPRAWAVNVLRCSCRKPLRQEQRWRVGGSSASPPCWPTNVSGHKRGCAFSNLQDRLPTPGRCGLLQCAPGGGWIWPVVAMPLQELFPLPGFAQREGRRHDTDENLRSQPLPVFGQGLLRVLCDATVPGSGRPADFVPYIGMGLVGHRGHIIRGPVWFCPAVCHPLWQTAVYPGVWAGQAAYFGHTTGMVLSRNTALPRCLQSYPCFGHGCSSSHGGANGLADCRHWSGIPSAARR